MTTWIACGIIGASLLVLAVVALSMASSLRTFRQEARTLEVRLRPAQDLLVAVTDLKDRAEGLQPRVEAASKRASDLVPRERRHPAG